MKRDVIYIVIIALMCIGMVNYYTRNKKEQAVKEQLYNAASDSLHQERNKLGQEKSSTALLYSSLKDFKALHVSDSSAIGKLQKMVDKLTISVTLLSNVTANTVSGVTTITLHDTVTGKDGKVYVYPEYKFSKKDKWQSIETVSNKDSTHVSYKVFNEFDLKQEWERSHWWGRKTPVASILNLNPHTQTLEMKTYTVQEHQGNRWRDFLFGVIASTIVAEAINLGVKIPIKLK